ncbi:hypothetical protein PMZ80_000896 [Knufia obscura]|uniref:Succinylglutamate desuccinylase/Aspartoacylase catalytic domain-containing protein n=1 Tax=Knufia obscura TaxID=1635080 RepID=A0ABR0S1N3_9EURO|nr:hypothetical protein PMZ80_000896 [Knufia obscura]
MKLSAALLLATGVAFASAQTNFTGDILKGYPVIEYLDLNDVPANTISRYWISAAEAQGGLPYFVPILVARGSEGSLETGRRLSLSASIHGDELNGIPVVQRVFAALGDVVSSGNFNGTIIGIPTTNPNGNIHNQRNFYSSSSNGFLTNLNRVFPGASIADGGSIADSYAYTIWNSVWANSSNADIAVDFHTLSTGSIGPLWAYADFRLDGVQRLAELAQPDHIKIDPGEPGSIETTWVDFGVPAITLEIGPAKNWNQTLIKRSEEFIWRLLDDLAMLPGNYTAPPETVSIGLENTYKGTNFSYVSVSQSGWVQMDVVPLQDVEEGQSVGTLFNSWGDVIENLTAPVAGRVHTVRVDAAAEQGAGVLDLLYNATST